MGQSATSNTFTSFSTWLPSLKPTPTDYQSLWDSVKQLHSITTHSHEISESEKNPTVHDDNHFIDPWERNFASNWLTRLMALSLRLSSVDQSSNVSNDWEALAAFAGDAVALLTGSPATTTQPFTRRSVFKVNLGQQSVSIEIVIREETMSYAAIGCQTWNSAPLLCCRIGAQPFHFFPQLVSTFPSASDDNHQKLIQMLYPDTPLFAKPSTPPGFIPRRPLKVLELGSGTGLVGITAAVVLARLLQFIPIDSVFDIELLLTDYHSKVLGNLRHNLELNAKNYSLPDYCQSTLSVRVEELDWRMLEGSSLARTGYQNSFDVILGSDLVYEPQHAIWVSNAVRYFLKPEPEPAPSPSTLTPEASRSISPGSTPLLEPSFHLLLPLRPTFARETQAVHLAFGGHDLHESFDSNDLRSLPTHSCKWEEEEGGKVSLKVSQGSIMTGLLTIKEYVKEKGVQFGQGCDSYQYLRIGHAV
ncbi:hypothetical protein CROQUDRAFT_136290 [Cronartium quercuum f. sp. fusiforme G11]|uniref:Uncharacterized protein n=1 Tax=Cronartium quercuum f. sp. fusiforme G11 TaxID=708437 RepID=A0A9P6T6T3_9BASI|nr:hypothetical protein CROQUDRAFT_136290 [Cronartium quercuum f. sp. fusiforme G11]